MATYTIIGGDQKPYNLVTEDNIRSWIAEGRLNPQSLMRRGDDTEWRALADYPEFAEALAAKAAPAAESPLLSGETAGPAKASGLAITSLVLGILGMFSCGATALIGLILGIIAMVKIKKSRGALGGGGLALAGTIVSAVFILMIPVFAAMLLPALARAEQRAQAINCVNNVKQLSVAVRLYAADNKDHYPAATFWCDALRSYVGTTNTFHCPKDFSEGICSYAFNVQAGGMEAGKVNPETVVIFEAASGWNLSGGPGLILASPRHGRIVVVGFADGHVEQVPASRLSKLRWNP
jgi:prepilin-type processing-associated H-X9-DG protein